MALPTVLGIMLPGVGIPLLATWMAGDIKFGKERQISEESIRKIAIGALAGIGVGAVTYILTRPTETAAAGVVTTARVQAAGNGAGIKLASPVGVGGFAYEPKMEFYSGTPPYPDGHIYVD